MHCRGGAPSVRKPCPEVGLAGLVAGGAEKNLLPTPLLVSKKSQKCPQIWPTHAQDVQTAPLQK